MTEPIPLPNGNLMTLTHRLLFLHLVLGWQANTLAS